MNKEKIKKTLKTILMIFVIISAILFWTGVILIIYGVLTGWFDEPIEIEPGIEAWNLG